MDESSLHGKMLIAFLITVLFIIFYLRGNWYLTEIYNTNTLEKTLVDYSIFLTKFTLFLLHT